MWLSPCRRIAVALLALIAARSSAGTLRGVVSLPKSERAQDTVVWLEQIPDRAEQQLVRPPRHWPFQHPPTPPLPVIVEAGRRYQPHILAIAAGSHVVLKNKDDVWHGTFSVSPALTFDLGKRPPGHEDTLGFPLPGLVALRCDIHPAMSAFVMVAPNHAFTRAEADGSWQLPKLPAGHYVVHAWHPEKPELRREVDVPERGEASLTLHW